MSLLLLIRIHPGISSNPTNESPSILVLPTNIPDREMLQCLLLEKRGQAVVGNGDGREEEEGQGIVNPLRIGAPQDAGEDHLLTYANQMAQKEASSLQSDKEKIRSGLEGLAEMLGLSEVPSVIEGYDISHLAGTNTVASKVSSIFNYLFSCIFYSFTIE